MQLLCMFLNVLGGLSLKDICLALLISSDSGSSPGSFPERFPPPSRPGLLQSNEITPVNEDSFIFK